MRILMPLQAVAIVMVLSVSATRTGSGNPSIGQPPYGGAGVTDNTGAQSSGNEASALNDTVSLPQGSGLPEGVECIADLIYAKRGERELRLDVFLPRLSAGPFPAVILIHGGRPSPRDRHHYGPLAAQLAEQGIVAVCVDYREVLDAPYPAAIEDARAAIDWLETNSDRYNIRPEAIAALGEGFGGYIAAMLGIDLDGSGVPSVDAVVGINPIVDLPSFNPTGQPPYSYVFHLFLGYPRAQRPDLWEQASPLTYVDSDAAPFLLFHSTKPKRNPLEQSTAMAEALEEAGVRVELVSPEGTGEDLMSAPHEVPRFARRVSNRLKRALWRLPDGVRQHNDLVYASPGGRDLRLDLYLPDQDLGSNPAVLLFHGGGWAWGDKGSLRGTAVYLAERGFATACVEYRLLRERNYPAAVDDAKAAVRWIRANADSFGIDADRIGAAGVSAGGHLAAMLAVTPDKTHFAEGADSPGMSAAIQAAVPISAVVDLFGTDKDDSWSMKTFLGCRPHEDPGLWRQASPTYHAEDASCAFLFMHAPADDLTRIEYVETMRQKLINAGIRAEMFTAVGGDHDFLWDLRLRDAALARMAEFLEEELRHERSSPGIIDGRAADR